MQALSFVTKMPIHPSVSVPKKLEKSLALLIFSLHQLLHLQVYCIGLKLLIYNIKICIDNCHWLTIGSHIMQMNI